MAPGRRVERKFQCPFSPPGGQTSRAILQRGTLALRIALALTDGAGKTAFQELRLTRPLIPGPSTQPVCMK